MKSSLTVENMPILHIFDRMGNLGLTEEEIKKLADEKILADAKDQEERIIQDAKEYPSLALEE